METEDIRNKKCGNGSLRIQNFIPQLCQIIFDKKYQTQTRWNQQEKGAVGDLKCLEMKT